jgi:glutamate transport system substrate-binding protein
MRSRFSLVAFALALTLVGLGCGKSTGSKATATTPTTTAPPPTFAAGSAMATIQQRGKLTVGIKFDQPLFGLKDPTTGKIDGFDADMAREVAKAIFGNSGDIDSKINFVETVSKNREPFIQNGTVDLVVATYTINATRKQVVDFAGPYFQAHEDIMVRSSENSIKTVTDLNGKKVCSVQGSTSLKNLTVQAPQADTSITFDTYSKCAEALADGRVQAEVTDNAILAGLAAQSSGKYNVLNAPFSDEPYGIGLKKGDTAFRTFLNDTIQKLEDNGTWQKLFNADVSSGGVKPELPSINRY